MTRMCLTQAQTDALVRVLVSRPGACLDIRQTVTADLIVTVYRGNTSEVVQVSPGGEIQDIDRIPAS